MQFRMRRVCSFFIVLKKYLAFIKLVSWYDEAMILVFPVHSPETFSIFLLFAAVRLCAEYLIFIYLFFQTRFMYNAIVTVSRFHKFQTVVYEKLSEPGEVGILCILSYYLLA